jgi:uracil phosphoribosyltransferase
MRAGNGLLDGMLEVVPWAPVGHIGLRRDPATLLPSEYYLNLPDDIAGRTVFLLDPMLATGGSAAAAIDRLKRAGAGPITLVCLIAVAEGITLIGSAHPDVKIVTAAIDPVLDSHGYIRPGLGDAGDRLYASFYRPY